MSKGWGTVVEHEDDYVTDFEVVEEAEGTSSPYRATATPRLIVPPAPVHPLSSLVTIAVDLLWAPFEAAATLAALYALIPLILTCGATCFVSVMLIQRYLDHDTWKEAIAKAGAMGIVAGVPYAVVGTAVGGVLLAWAGIHNVELRVRGYLPPQSE